MNIMYKIRLKRIRSRCIYRYQRISAFFLLRNRRRSVAHKILLWLIHTYQFTIEECFSPQEVEKTILSGIQYGDFDTYKIIDALKKTDDLPHTIFPDMRKDIGIE